MESCLGVVWSVAVSLNSEKRRILISVKALGYLLLNCFDGEDVLLASRSINGL